MVSALLVGAFWPCAKIITSLRGRVRGCLWWGHLERWQHSKFCLECTTTFAAQAVVSWCLPLLILYFPVLNFVSMFSYSSAQWDHVGRWQNYRGNNKQETMKVAWGAALAWSGQSGDCFQSHHLGSEPNFSLIFQKRRKYWATSQQQTLSILTF